MANQPTPPRPSSHPAANPEHAPPAIGIPADDQRPDPSAVPKDFKLPPVGSRDYVAGQPIDEEEFHKTQAEAKQRKEAADKALADAKHHKT